VRRFDAIICNGTNNNKRHFLIVDDAAGKMEAVLSRVLRILPDLMALSLAYAVQLAGAWWILRTMAADASKRARMAIAVATALSLILILIAFLLRFGRVNKYFSEWVLSWGRGLVIGWILLSFIWLAVLILIHAFARRRASHSPSRRQFLRGAQVVAFAAPAVAGFGMFIRRNRFSVQEHKISIADLPPDLDGLRLVQITDIHMSPFLSRADLESAVAMANETRAHIALVTGDLITTFGDPLDDCLNALGALRAEAGVFGCMGNHEHYVGAEDYTELEAARLGIQFLRRNASALHFGKATLNLVGVDYQTLRQPYLVGMERLVAPNAFNVMLSHNPDVFPVAVEKGYDLTISGHTHGGQVRVEILGADLNPARFYTPYTDGLYRQDSAAVFVSRGIGTIGVPARFGAPAEVSLIQLARA
jgi:uncharacterized protein